MRKGGPRGIALAGGAALGLALLAGVGLGVLRGAGVSQSQLDSRPAEAYFDAAFLRRSEDYNRAQLLFALNARAVRWAAYLTLLLTPAFGLLAARLARRLPGREGLRTFLLAWAVLLTAFVAVLPISFASSHWMEHRWGLSRQSAVGWIADAAKLFLLWGGVLSLLIGLTFVLRRRLPRMGWLVLAAVVVVAAGLATFAFPVVVDPLFNRFRPLEEGPLRRDLIAMAAREGIHLDEVLVMDASVRTVRENAYFTGLGRTKRVVLWDNLLANASPDEVRLTFAHELGHWSRGHVVRGLVLASLAIPVVCGLLWWAHGRLAQQPRLGLAGPADPGGIPLFLLLVSIGLFAVLPVENAVSRAFEREADRVALELTRDPAAFIESKRRSAVVNLSWVDPPGFWKWLFWSHPTTLERIRMAESPEGIGS